MIRPGDRIGRYEVVRSLGAGGMGSVWEAATPDGQLVALKLMHDHLADDSELVQRFRREYEVGRRLRHPNLVAMLDYGTAGTIPYLVMALTPGKSLRRLLEKGGPFREWEVLEIAAGVADGLVALHAHGVIHRDLKASNIIVDRNFHAVVIDFGIARLSGERTLTTVESFLGSAEYSSPEPHLGRPAVPRSDVYALGIVLYELLTGRVPFRSDRYTDTLRMHAEYPVPRISTAFPAVSPGLDNLVYAMLQKSPDARPSAEQVALACRAMSEQHGRAPAPAPVPPPPPFPGPSRVPPAPQPAPAERSETGMRIALAVFATAAAIAVGAAMILAAAA